MRKGLLFGLVVLASTFVGGTALAERSDSDSKYNRGQAVKERVLEKQREGVRASRHEGSQQRSTIPRSEKIRPKGDTYGDQAQRSAGRSRASERAGRNMSASNSVNTPREIKAMLQMVNPMYGAYRTSQAAEGTDAYGGGNPGNRATGPGAKNRSASGAVNTPVEIRQMIKRIHPMHGAYRTNQSGFGTDAYGGKSLVPYAYGNRNTIHVHFKNDRGEVMNSTVGNTATAMKNRELRDRMIGMMKEKMARASKIEGK